MNNTDRAVLARVLLGVSTEADALYLQSRLNSLLLEVAILRDPLAGLPDADHLTAEAERLQ